WGFSSVPAWNSDRQKEADCSGPLVPAPHWHFPNPFQPIPQKLHTAFTRMSNVNVLFQEHETAGGVS
ncbi:hypothetical protein M404DRAFT_1008487, partial [Pisolithus tinctorius Marx 270]